MPLTGVANAEDYKFFKSSTSIINSTPTVKLYGVSSSGTETLLNTWESSRTGIESVNADIMNGRIDQYNGKIYFDVQENTPGGGTTYTSVLEYDLSNKTIQTVGNITQVKDYLIYPKGIVNMISEKSDGSIQIGSDTNDIDITAEGLNIDGNSLITKKDNGEIHIGKNSLITTSEEKTLSDGTKVQPLYAKDADGNKIPINIDGSKLLIDGVEVTAGGGNAQVTTNKNNIKNLGEGVAGSTALTAALTALPQTSKESKLSCGVGTGAYSSRYAVGFGCASKVNKRVDINAGGSYVFGGSKSYGDGTLDNGLIKAGFVFKLGELNQSTQISMKDKKIMETKIESLEEKNKKLLSRLEQLEKIALNNDKLKDIAVYQLK